MPLSHNVVMSLLCNYYSGTLLLIHSKYRSQNKLTYMKVRTVWVQSNMVLTCHPFSPAFAR